MGNLLSSPEGSFLDGLEFSSPIKRSFNIADAREKLEQLLRASTNGYRPGSVAAPLTAAFYLGADPATLTNLYEEWNAQLCQEWPEDDPVADSIGKDNLDEFYGDRRYDQRYYEYFRDCLTEVPGWNSLVTMHMPQLWYRLVNGNLVPLIELAVALETDSGMVAAAALTLACTLDQGDVEVDNTTKVNVDHIEGAHLSTQFRRLAKRALELRNLECTSMVHACAEVFLSPKMRLLALEQEVPILQAVEKYLANAESGTMPVLSPEEALASKDVELIVFTRSRLVLQKLAV